MFSKFIFHTELHLWMAIYVVFYQIIV